MNRYPSIRRLGLALLVSALTLTAAAFADDWPQWRGANRDDLSAETGLLQAWPEGGPQRLWVQSNCGAGYSGFSVVGDRLFTLGQAEGVQFALCLNAATGEEFWRQTVGQAYENGYGDGPRGTPTVDGDALFVLTAAGDLAALTAADGTLRWKVSLVDAGGAAPNWGYAESVLVDGPRVVCTPGGSQGAVLAVDRSTGNKIWQSDDFTHGAHYSSIVRAELDGRTQYVQLFEKAVAGFDPETGDLLWESEWPGSVAVIPTPIVRDNRVYVTSGYGAGSKQLEFENGQPKERWMNKVMKNHHGGVILVGDYLYGYSDGPGWICQSWETGERVWNENSQLGKGAIASADGRLYCLGEQNGELVLIEASHEGWKERGRFKLDPQSTQRSSRGGVWVHPVIAHGRLYLRDQEHIVCYDIRR